MKKISLLALLGGIIFFACKKEQETTQIQITPVDFPGQKVDWPKSVDARLFNYNRDIPSFMKALGHEQPVFDNGKATLGKVLFYDKNLSADFSVSCASCHQPEAAFGDVTAFSKGVNGQLSTRNSMALANVVNFRLHHTPLNGIQTPLLWDGRALSVEEQAPLALMNPHEMGMTWELIEERVNLLPYYKTIFSNAYGDEQISKDRILESMSEFVGAIGSFGSTLDMTLDMFNGNINGASSHTVLDSVKVFSQYTGDTVVMPLQAFTTQQLRGRNLFVQNCSKCHSPVRNFQEVQMACNGLDMTYSDQGVGALTGKASDNGVFKSPSLRNITFTAPYMHDGRFKTLAEVIDFYSTGIQPHPNLHPLLKNADGSSLKMQFTQEDKLALLSFLGTMTAHDLRTLNQFHNPFIYE